DGVGGERQVRAVLFHRGHRQQRDRLLGVDSGEVRGGAVLPEPAPHAAFLGVMSACAASCGLPETASTLDNARVGDHFRSFEETDMSRPERAVAADNEVQELMAKARTAQATYEAFSQEQVDAIVRDMAKFVYDNAEKLARMAVDETGIGNYEDKVLKKKGKARVIWNNLKGKKSRGIIGEDPENNLVFVAKPMGVVAAVCPVTNPIATPMCNGMFALKAGNAVIFAPHPKAQKCTEHLTKEFQKIVKKHGGPDNLVQTIKQGSIEKTQELMKSVDVVVATGGGAMGKRGR